MLDPIRLIEIIILLGLVIFVHELGHFLAARWAGVLVERFSIGFGPLLLAFRRGETEYAISAIPLGGYVKMLGQSDTPTVDEPSEDPRSYQNKTVFQRMVIISAGVVMNVIFGAICFAIAYMNGVPQLAAAAGAVTPARPAWKAGVEPGDRVIQLNGVKDPSYEDLVNRVMLTSPGVGTVHLVVERNGKEIPIDVVPERIGEDRKPTIGVTPEHGMTLIDNENVPPTIPGSQAALAKNPGFEGGDKVVAVNGTKVETPEAFKQLMFEHRRDPVTITVERFSESESKTATSTAEIKVEPAHMRTLGLRMTMGEILAIRPDSPAANAVNEKGDREPVEATDKIVAVDGETDFDPLRLADMIADKNGEKVELTLKRKGRTTTDLKVYLEPENVPAWNDFISPPGLSDWPMSIPSLGIAFEVFGTVDRVEPDSPAAKASKPIQPGDVLREMAYTFHIDGESKTVSRDVSDQSWAGIFWGLQDRSLQSVEMTFKSPGEGDQAKEYTVSLVPVEDPSWPLAFRGLNFREDSTFKKANGFVEGVVMGMQYTWTTLSRVYLTLRGLVMNEISPEMLSGPLRLGHLAYVVSQDWMMLVLLIGLININLAVVNFLPIPVLDGGHMVFLLYEGITRRRPNEKFVLAAHIFGLSCIVALMCFVLYLDVRHFWNNL